MFIVIAFDWFIVVLISIIEHGEHWPKARRCYASSCFDFFFIEDQFFLFFNQLPQIIFQ